MAGNRSRTPALMVVACVLSTLAHGRVATQQIPTIPEGTGAIAGTVVDAGTGRPIAGAVVGAVMQLVIEGRPAISGVNRQVTDAAGRFVFTKLPAADFTIQASRSGYFDGGFGQVSQRAGGRRISLAAGEWFPNAAVRLWRHSSITGTVLDEVGEPVVGAWIRALSHVLIAGESQWVSGPVTKTDDRGVYRFAGLTPGRWIVMVPSVQTAVPADTSAYAMSGLTPVSAAFMEASGRSVPLRNDPVLALDDQYRLVLGQTPVPPPSADGRPQVYPITFHPGTRTIADAGVLDTTYGDDRVGIDVALRPAPAVTVSGRMEGPPDAIGGMLVRLAPVGAEGLGRANEAGTTLSLANGTFTFLNVAAGAYTILANRSTSGYIYNPVALLMTGSMPAPPGLVGGSMSGSGAFAAPQGTMFETYTQEGNTAYSGHKSITVGEVPLTDVVIPLTRGISISGRFVVDATAGTTDPSRLLVLSLIAEPAGGEPALGQPRFNPNRNDPSQAFRIEGLQAGEYLLRAIVGAGLIKSVVHDGRDHTYRPFDASSGQDITDVVITLTDQIARLSGTVRDGQSRPLTSNTAVICFPAERDQWSRYGIQPVRLQAVGVGSDGAYRFTRLPAGDYLLVAVEDAHLESWKDPRFLEKMAASAQKVTLAWGETKSQDLTLASVR